MIKNEWWINFVIVILTVLSGYCILIIQSQIVANKILFQPPPASYADDSEILKLKTIDGKKISAIYLKNNKAKFVILYSHGNAIDLGLLFPFLTKFQSKGYSILAYDYHGYGTSEGKPSEKNTYYDIDAAYQYLVQTQKISPSRIIAMGDSLGAGVTLNLAVKKPVAGVILQGPFISAFRVYTIFPILPFDKYNNLEKITKLKIPILFIHGRDDKIIPFWHAQHLYKVYQNNKHALWVDNADHNNLTYIAGNLYWQRINQFLRTLP